MPRPRKYRRCHRYTADRIYKPRGVPLSEISIAPVGLDEFEAMRWCDLEGLDQSEAGERMGISRGTVQRLLRSGRQKLIRAILDNQALAVNLRESEDFNAGMHSHQRRGRAGRHGQ